MKLLADENVDRPIVEALRRLGHDVRYIAECASSEPDDAVLAIANAEDRVLITCDTDFGNLVYRQNKLSVGLLLLRLSTGPIADRLAAFDRIWNQVEPRLSGHFVVATEVKIRIRRLPRSSA